MWPIWKDKAFTCDRLHLSRWQLAMKLEKSGRWMLSCSAKRKSPVSWKWEGYWDNSCQAQSRKSRKTGACGNKDRINRTCGIKTDWKQPNHNDTQSYRKRQHSPPPCRCRGGSSCGCRSGDPPSPTPSAPGSGSRAVSGTADHTSPAQGWKPRSSCPDRLLL